jgi:hypothetical protein
VVTHPLTPAQLAALAIHALAIAGLVYSAWCGWRSKAPVPMSYSDDFPGGVEVTGDTVKYDMMDPQHFGQPL